MKISDKIKCTGFPCLDINKNGYMVPPVEIDVTKIKILMITEAPPPVKADYFYASGSPFYLQTTLQSFNDAGADVKSMQDIIDLGVYVTTAIKCPKAALTISPSTLKNCSALLEEEVALFPDVKVFFLGGGAAITMMNNIRKEKTGKKVIPAGSTYKIRGQKFYFKNKRVLPSYTPAGKNFMIEKSKRRMAAEDIREAMSVIRQSSTLSKSV